ncbi:hypothetical protein Desaci_0721 [Desulfosporosinus acidiphilus SJ4]|uniref:AMMECR1 domain-containing protein n=1 Tax=Desulfosporosinus acidiphilus (strain DSM 22704 / JCM 16185 / SJ4) TaxID=646529 RepID=I4D1V8_DESAJ|nr:AmmeMemoRadiSam system protein A [Desulfosporosinus acidiphilus]AFM39782.1 hypothetical protein Desaci_0721 [Desulfosporosinus acidiphilus SJ4]
MSLVYIAFVPHPPIVIPEIGGEEVHKCQSTLEAYREIARRLAAADIETVVLVSPHAPLTNEGITLFAEANVQGSFAQFGAGGLNSSWSNDLSIVNELQQHLKNMIPIKGKIDHGALVPLYFLQEAGWRGKVVLMGMPLKHPDEYGRQIGRILDQYQGRVALIASGDLSHRLKKEGPYGFDPAGPEFDQAIFRGLQRDVRKINDIPVRLIENAGECGYRSLQLALAAKEGAPQVLSYEGPFGVGYLVADLYHSSPLPRWARRCLQAHLKHEELKLADFPQEPEFFQRGGCFVTLKQNGQLRGCIGTTTPWQENLALEIKHNAVAAGTEDPRFWPVEIEELESLTITVDVLGDLEKISEPEELDPWRYGVVVRRGGKSGLLLPHLEGVDTVSEQISIAKQKAGISPREEADLWRFEVVRHYE